MALTEKFFDSAAAGGGNGSLASPYNTLASLTALTGIKARLKRGSVFNEPWSVTGNGFEIVDYGDALARPMLTGAVAVNSGWIADSTSGVWYHPTAGLHFIYFDAALATVAPDSVIGRTAGRFATVASLALCRATVYTAFWDTGTSRLYGNFGTTTAPTGITMTSASFDTGIRGDACYNFELSEVDVRFFENFSFNFAAGSGDGIYIHDVSAWYTSGRPATGGGQGSLGFALQVAGLNAGARKTNVAVDRADLQFSYSDSLLFNDIDGLSAHNNFIAYANNVIECHQQCLNARFTVNRAHTIGYGGSGGRNTFLALVGDNGQHTNVLLEGNIGYFLRAHGANIMSSDGFKARGNVFYKYGHSNLSSSGVLLQNQLGGTNVNPTVKNNILVSEFSPSTNNNGALEMYNPGAVDAFGTGGIDNNLYWTIGLAGDGAPYSTTTLRLLTYRATNYFAVDKTTFNNNTHAYKIAAALDGAEQNSKNFDPLFVDPDNGDFRLQGGSPALSMGANYWAGAAEGRPSCLHSAAAGMYTAGAAPDTAIAAGAVQAKLIA